MAQLRKAIPRRPAEPQFDMLAPPSRAQLEADRSPSASSQQRKSLYGESTYPNFPPRSTRGLSGLRASQTVNNLISCAEGNEGDNHFGENSDPRLIAPQSRLPSPIAHSESAGRRYVSTPILPSQKEVSISGATTSNLF